MANLDLSPELEDILAAHCVENESTRKAVIEAALIVYFERYGWRFYVQDGRLMVVPPPAQAAAKEEVTLLQRKSQNGRWGLALVGPQAAGTPGIEFSYAGHVWPGYTYKAAGTAAGVEIYRLIPAPGKFVLAARQDIIPVTGCQGVSMDLQGNGDISLVTGDPDTAVWRQWRTRRRGSVLMRLSEAGRPREVQPHEAVALSL